MNAVQIQRILFEIHSERKKQFQKWGDQNKSLPEFVSILTEEVGEVAKEANKFHNREPYDSGHKPKYDYEHGQIERLKWYREELIQVAAVAVQMIENVESMIKKLEE
ncbi:MAG: hypothetical protein WCY16_10180 [Weeksellaceae bacterium]